MSIQGKLLVTVTDHQANCPDIHVVVLSCDATSEDSLDAFTEAVQCDLELGIESILSKRQRALPEGTTIRLRMTCRVGWTQDYWGECDSDMEVLRLETRREQLPNRKLRKRWKLWDKQQARKAFST